MFTSNLTNVKFYVLPSPSNLPFFCLLHNLAVTRFPWSLKAEKQRAEIIPLCSSQPPVLIYLTLLAGGLCYAVPSQDGFLSPQRAPTLPKPLPLASLLLYPCLLEQTHGSQPGARECRVSSTVGQESPCTALAPACHPGVGQPRRPSLLPHSPWSCPDCDPA